MLGGGKTEVSADRGGYAAGRDFHQHGLSAEALAEMLRLSQAEVADLRAAEAEARSKLGTTETMICAFLGQIVAREVPRDQIPAALFQLAAQWREAGQRIDALGASQNLAPQLERLRAEAKAAHATERLEDLWRLLSEIELQEQESLDRLEAHAREVAQEAALRRAGLVETKRSKLAVALSAADANGAAALIAEIVALETPDPAARFWALLRAQDEWYARGRDRGLNLDLSVSVRLARAALAAAGDADQRGAAQNNLGNALQTLGAREAGTARLEEAVAAYRTALEEITRDRVPLDWATTQNNLGSALQTLGEREAGTARLEEAVAAHRAALQEWTRDRVPLDWATTQNNLGNALQTLGAREAGTARLEEAVAAYRAALEELTRDRVPLSWAATQNNLGNALATLGAREAGTAPLEEAVAAYRAALEERARDRVPLGWAMTQNNLGTALATLGEREAGTARLKEAIAAFRAALEERTEAAAPFDRALTLENVVLALMPLAERTGDAASAAEAVAAAEAALATFRRAGADYNVEKGERTLAAARALAERLSHP